MADLDYSEVCQDSPSKVFSTQSAQEVLLPVAAQLEKERQRILNAMQNKNLDEEEYKTLLTGLDTTTKNIQLLGGKPTEITKTDIDESLQKEIELLKEKLIDKI